MLIFVVMVWADRWEIELKLWMQKEKFELNGKFYIGAKFKCSTNRRIYVNCSESLTILRELDDFSNAKSKRAPELIQTILNVNPWRKANGPQILCRLTQYVEPERIK